MSSAAPAPAPEPPERPERRGPLGREGEGGLRFLDHAPLDRRVVELALRQHGVMTLAQLTAFGITARAVQLRAAAGRLHRLYRGVYSIVPPDLLLPGGRRLAAVLACGPGAALSHASAASLLGLRPSAAIYTDVTVPARSALRHHRIRVHRSTTLTRADLTEVEGIPCTTVTRTLVDLAAVLQRRAIERAFDQADALRVLNVAAIQEQLERRPTCRGVRTIQPILEEHYIGSTETWSELEEAFMALVDRAGLPRPESNRWIDPDDGEPAIRVDFMWRAQRVVVEVDGLKTHFTKQSFEGDRRRDQRLTVAAWRPVRTTSRQIHRHGGGLIRTLRALVLR